MKLVKYRGIKNPLYDQIVQDYNTFIKLMV